MALSGSLSTSKYEGRYYTLEWSATQNVASNKSTISWTLKAVGGSASWYAERTLKVVIAGTTRYSKTDRVERYTGTVATGSFDLTHDSAGNKSFSASVEAAVYVSSVNCTGSKSFTLTSIPRQATLTSAPNFNDEDNPVISYSNPAGSAVSALQACIASSDGSTVYVAYRDISKTGASYTFNLTTAERNTLRNLIPNSKSLTVKFYVKTVIGSSTFYSSLAKTFSITNANPTLSPTVTDSDSAMVTLTGDANKLVKYYSDATFSFGASAQKGATIKSYKVVNGSKSSTSSSGTLSNVESGTFTFTVTDSRGNTTTKTVTKTLISYVKLTVNASGSLTTDGKLTATVSGNYFNGSIGSTSNTLTCKYRYRVKGGSYNSWTTLSATKSGNSYSASFSATGLNYRKNYEVQFQVTDKIRDLNKTITVYCEPVFDWGADDFKFNVPVTIDGNLNVTGTITGTQAAAIADDDADYVVEIGSTSMGSNGTWYWRKWNSGRAECYGCRNYGNMGVSTAWGVLYRSEVFNQALPSGLFTTTPEVIDITFRNSNFGAWIAKHETSAPTSTNSGSFIVIRPASATLSQAYISFNVIGRWK